jgi:RNA polymerase-binding transcription factor DksA
MSLKKEQLEKFKEKLNDTKTEILADFEKLKKGLDFGNDVDSMDEETDETEERSYYVGVKNLLDGRLRAVEDALAKIDAGTYGTCEKCGGEIETKVLEAVPESRLCKNCKATG